MAFVRPLITSIRPHSDEESGLGSVGKDGDFIHHEQSLSPSSGEFEESPGQIFQARHRFDGTIYILGVGNLGSFVAHSLAGLPARPPITLLLRDLQARIWEERGGSIDVTGRGMTETRHGFNYELLPRIDKRDQSSDAVDSETSATETEAERPTSGSSRYAEPSQGPGSGKETFISEARPEHEGTVFAESAELQQPRHATPRNTAGEVEARVVAGEESQVHARSASTDLDSEPADLRTKHINQRLDAISGFENEEQTIRNLIVTVKGPDTVRALQAVAHRITKDSAILFLQNGMGIIDEINEKLFPDEDARPTYIIGVVSHGLYPKSMFSVIHAGEGTIALGIMPPMPMKENTSRRQLRDVSASARYIMRTITRTPLFVAVGFPPTDLLQQQLDKIAVNCIINPLTAIFNIKNGDLLFNFHFTRVIRLLLAEISIVIRNLEELKNVPNVNMRFDPLRLERLVFSIANSTAANKSSMLQDVEANKNTEIDYINGYIVKRGEQMGLHCVMNYMLVHMIKGKRKALWKDADPLPLEGFGRPT